MKIELLYVTAFLLMGWMASGQTQTGSYIVGGNVELNTARNDTKLALTPSVGYFIMDNFAVGANLSVDYRKIEGTKITTWGLGPFTRYYFGNLNFRPFVHADVSFQSNKTRNTFNQLIFVD